MRVTTRANSKIRIRIIVLLSIVITIISGVLVIDRVDFVPSNNAEIFIEDCSFNPFNNFQVTKGSKVMLTAWNNELYVYVKCGNDTLKPYENKLSVFKNGSLSVAGKSDMEAMAFVGEYMYGYRKNDLEFSTVYAYNIRTGQETALCTTITPVYGYIRGAHFTWDGEYYLPDWPNVGKNGDFPGYYVICGGNIAQMADYQESYTLGDSTYYKEWNYYKDSIIHKKYDQSEVILGFPNKDIRYKFIVPVEQGLLIYITDYYGTEPDCLYLITEDAESPTCLFTLDIDFCMPAINKHNNNIYISIQQLTSDGFFSYSWGGYNGTYRIDLEDYSVEKLNSKTYSGLFIFDNSGIYACDYDNNIYKLDFDGNVESVILKD